MRWYGQLALVAVLGGAGYAGWLAYKDGSLARLPVVGEYVAGLGGQGAGSAAAPQPVATAVVVGTGPRGRLGAPRGGGRCELPHRPPRPQRPAPRLRRLREAVRFDGLTRQRLGARRVDQL